MIKTIRDISPNMPIVVYMNDLPDCRYDITFKTINESLKNEIIGFNDIYILAIGRDFT